MIGSRLDSVGRRHPPPEVAGLQPSLERRRAASEHSLVAVLVLLPLSRQAVQGFPCLLRIFPIAGLLVQPERFGIVLPRLL
jgi:hypothetical protein